MKYSIRKKNPSVECWANWPKENQPFLAQYNPDVRQNSSCREFFIPCASFPSQFSLWKVNPSRSNPPSCCPGAEGISCSLGFVSLDLAGISGQVGTSGIRRCSCCARAVPVLCHLELSPGRGDELTLGRAAPSGIFLRNCFRKLFFVASEILLCELLTHNKFNPKSWPGIYPEYSTPASCWEPQFSSAAFGARKILKYWGKHKYMAQRCYRDKSTRCF